MSAEATGWHENFDAVIGLGSNIGDKAANITAAIQALTEAGDIRVVRSSRLYRTAPWGKLDQDWFVNAAIAVATTLPPRLLLERCLAVEAKLKRVRAERWGPRIIDVDVLIYRNEALADPVLTLPHPRITERAFVLVPLADIAPHLRLAGRTVTEHLTAIDHADVMPFEAASKH